MSVEAHEIVLVAEPEPALRSTRRRLSSPVATAVVVAITVLWTIPTVGLFVTSIRPVWLAKGSGWWTILSDRTVTFDNYAQVISGGELLPEGIVPFMFNTVAIVIPATVVPILLACMAAYALAWIPFRGASVVFVGVVALQVLPIQMTLLPLLTMFSNGWSLGPVPVFPNLDNPETGRALLMGTFVPLWLVHSAVALPLAIFLMHNFIARMPRELMDAARIDGASHYVVFRRIVLPLALPAIAAFAIFQFLWVWNDYIVALTFAGGTSDVAPVTPYLARLSGGFGGFGLQEHLLTAGAFVAIIVPIAVFLLLQRHFVRGLVTGAIDG
jgi:alpha-glucoside transport system permease protein